jgi:phage gp45-like
MRSTPYDMATRIFNMLARAILVKKVNDVKLLQEHDIELLADESRKGVERFQFPFLTSVPHVENKLGNLEEIVGCIGGIRSHMVIIAADDRRYRICGLQNGELMIHDEQGQQVHITRGGVFTSIPHDLQIDVRIMKADKGNPTEPTKGIQASKPTTKDDGSINGDDVVAYMHFDKKAFTVTRIDKDGDDKPFILEKIVHYDKDKKKETVISSMTMDMDGITWLAPKMTWNCPDMTWNNNGDEHDPGMTWNSAKEMHNATNSIDTNAIRTTMKTKKPNDIEDTSVIETVHPTDQGGVTLIGMEKSKDAADASNVVTVTGEAKHTKALPS